MKIRITTKKQILEKKVKDYRKVLKNDEDWDWTYILGLLQYKLERTRKCITANKIIAEAPKIAKQILAVEVLLARVNADNYYEEISKDFHKKYGQVRMISIKPGPGTQLNSVHSKYTKETPKNSKKNRREGLKLIRKAERLQRRDLKKAFDLMLRDIWGWWD